jgi:hypothetical protein
VCKPTIQLFVMQADLVTETRPGCDHAHNFQLPRLSKG